MKYSKGSVDYKVNLESLHEMEEVIPMTSTERARLRKWVKDGHDIESNPWDYLNADGSKMNYLQCLRIRNGYSHGPWDSWEYSIPWKWDLFCRELIECDTLSK